jgi:hypothetical protein
MFGSSLPSVVCGRTHVSFICYRFANVSLFFNSLSNRLRITNYCLRSVSSNLLKFTYQKSSQYLKSKWKKRDVSWPKIIEPERISCHHVFSLCLEILTWFLVYECIMMSYRSRVDFVPVQWFLISKLICNLWLYTLIPKIKSISQVLVK